MEVRVRIGEIIWWYERANFVISRELGEALCRVENGTLGVLAVWVERERERRWMTRRFYI